jgi:transposase-like protein
MVSLFCPRCRLDDATIKCGFNKSGSQRFQCKRCNHYFTLNGDRPTAHSCEHNEAISLYKKGKLSLRDIAKKIGIAHQTANNWINKSYRQDKDARHN